MVVKKYRVSSKIMKKLTKIKKASSKTYKNKNKNKNKNEGKNIITFSSNYYVKKINDNGKVIEKGISIIDNSKKPTIEITTLENGKKVVKNVPRTWYVSNKIWI